MNKRVYLRLLTIGLRKIIMYQIWYDYIKPKYGEKAKLSCMDTDIAYALHSFIAYIKTDDIYINISLYL